MREVIIIFAAILTLSLGSSTAFAFWPFFWGTHDKITEDALDFINPTEYPDIHMFEEELRDGSATEAHAPPDVPGDDVEHPHKWFPNIDAWWDHTTNPEKECALELYNVGFDWYLREAYERIGYMCHNTQDLYVPSHQNLCIHGTLSTWTDGLGALTCEVQQGRF